MKNEVSKIFFKNIYDSMLTYNSKYNYFSITILFKDNSDHSSNKLVLTRCLTYDLLNQIYAATIAYENHYDKNKNLSEHCYINVFSIEELDFKKIKSYFSSEIFTTNVPLKKDIKVLEIKSFKSKKKSFFHNIKKITTSIESAKKFNFISDSYIQSNTFENLQLYKLSNSDSLSNEELEILEILIDNCESASKKNLYII